MPNCDVSGGGMGSDWAVSMPGAVAMRQVVLTISDSGGGLPSMDMLPSFAVFNLNFSRVSFAAKVRLNQSFIE